MLNIPASSVQVDCRPSIVEKDRFANETRVDYLRACRAISAVTLPRIDALRGISTRTIWAEFSLGVLGRTTHLLNDGNTAALTARIQLAGLAIEKDRLGDTITGRRKGLGYGPLSKPTPCVRSLKSWVLVRSKYPTLSFSADGRLRQHEFDPHINPIIANSRMSVGQSHFETKTRNQRRVATVAMFPKDAGSFPDGIKSSEHTKTRSLEEEVYVPARCF
ncbi:hypothetical protein F5146DRAFT_1005860 [Armillaria mellea]|nr:hypothetical protein F5146DRAFT_1005860 [Armillaria mellea]